MMNFVFDEKKEIEKMLDCRTLDTCRFSNIINDLTRYNLHVLGISDKNNIECTSRWLLDHCKNYNDISYSSVIADYVKNAHKYPLKKIDSIKIYRSELNVIENVKDIKKEKVLFVLLCIAKYQKEFFNYQNGKYVCSNAEVFKMARVNIPADQRDYMMNSINTLINCSKKNDGNERYVTFISDGNNDIVEFEMNAVDYLELAFRYLSWKDNGAGYDHCKKCGRLYRKKHNAGSMKSKDCNIQQFCYECIKYEKLNYKTIICADCGKEVKVHPKDNKSIRCESCQHEVEKALKREWWNNNKN